MDTISDNSPHPASALSPEATAGEAITRLARLAIGGQLAFVALWLVAGVVEPDYNPFSQTISELASHDSHHAWIVTAAFLVFGASLAALGVALYRSVAGHPRAWMGTSMLLVGAAFMPVVAGARMDCSRSSQACRVAIDADLVSGEHQLHDLASLVVFLMLVFAPLVYARRFRNDPTWSDLRAFSRRTTAVAFALLVVFVAVADGTGIGGLVQRLLLAVIAAWMIVVARRAHRHAML